jgi:hypothetical protein
VTPDEAKALLYEADVIEAQSQDVKALSASRRKHLAHSATRLRLVAEGHYPYTRVSYGNGLRARHEDEPRPVGPDPTEVERCG